jgi:hypothetical protein
VKALHCAICLAHAALTLSRPPHTCTHSRLQHAVGQPGSIGMTSKGLCCLMDVVQWQTVQHSCWCYQFCHATASKLQIWGLGLTR